MSVEPSGMMSLPLKTLREMLAACAAFQTWLGLDAEDLEEGQTLAGEAEKKIFYVAMSPEEYAATEPPYAVVCLGGKLEMVRDSRGQSSGFEQGGGLLIILQGAVDPAQQIAEVELTFANSVGAILTDLLAMAGQPGHLDISAIRQAGPIYRPSEDKQKTQGDFQQVILEVEYGSNA
jgi:hypothetical protein